MEIAEASSKVSAKRSLKVYAAYPYSNLKVSELDKGAIVNGLKGIYGKAVVSWSVEVVTGFAGVDLGENGLDWASSDLLSSYNTEMNSVISAFKAFKADADPEAYYLFIVPGFSESGVEGFMPRNRRFGFVTLAQLKDRTVAHELGHGAFNLRHTFPEVPQGATDNLMDYAEGVNLYKPQWDLIHNPEFTTGLWDGMEDGASITLSSLTQAIHNANMTNTKSLPVVKENCEKKAFSNFKVGENTMTYIHLICGDLQRDDQFPYDASSTGIFNWSSALTDNSVYIDPSEESKEEVTGIKDGLKYVIYKFHEVKINDVPLSSTMTDNMLFHIMVRKDESKDFEYYLYNKSDNENSTNDQMYDKALNQPVWSSQFGYFCGLEIINCFDLYLSHTRDSKLVDCGSYCGTRCAETCFGMVGYTIYENDRRDIYTRSNSGTMPFLTQGTESSSDENFVNLLSEIKSSLNGGFAVVAGVFKKAKIDKETSNGNKATHHFIVIVGMVLNGNQGKLFYHEVGSVNEEYGKMQVLDIDVSKMLISGYSEYLKLFKDKVKVDSDYPLYILTEIRVKPEFRIVKNK